MTGVVKEIPVDLVEVGNFNPRRFFDPQHTRELAESIKRDGQWDPVIVKPNSRGYDLIAGECRLRAIKILGYKTIAVRILDINEDEAHLLALKTNLMRLDLNPIEEAFAISNLHERGWSVEKIAKELNKSQTWVFLRLKFARNASEGLRNAVLTKEMPFSSAVQIANLSEGLQGSVASKVIYERLNLNEVTRFVNLMKLAENNDELEFYLRTPFKEINAHYPEEVRPQIRNVGKNSNITVISCDCGVKYIVDWSKKQVVGMRKNI